MKTEPGVRAAPEDAEAVRRAVQDYFQAWYTGDANRARRCLHPDLAKRRVAYDPASGTWILRHVDARRMVQLMEQGGGSNLPEADRWQDITVLDVVKDIASAKFVSHEYVEYLHLARFGQDWLIVNTLWEPRDSTA